MRITSKGQVTIPKEIREAAGLLPQTEVEFVMSGGRVILRKQFGKSRRGAKLIAALRGQGTANDTDEIWRDPRRMKDWLAIFVVSAYCPTLLAEVRAAKSRPPRPDC